MWVSIDTVIAVGALVVAAIYAIPEVERLMTYRPPIANTILRSEQRGSP